MVAFAADIALVHGEPEVLDEMAPFGLKIDPSLSTLSLACAEHVLVGSDIDVARAVGAGAERIDALSGPAGGCSTEHRGATGQQQSADHCGQWVKTL